MLSPEIQRVTEVLIDPLALLFLAGLLSFFWLFRHLSRRYRGRKGRWVVTALLLGFTLLVGAPALVNPLVGYFEGLHPVSPICRLEQLPLVVLGGGIDSRTETADQIDRMSSSTLARTMAAATLIQEQSNLIFPVVLSGGGRATVTEADLMSFLLIKLGINEARLLTETKSYSTASNANNLAELFVSEKLPLDIRLLTSALHMVRAKAVFEAAGFNVCALPVDHQALDNVPAYALLPQTTALVKFGQWLHEIVGLVGYKLTGAISQ